MRKTVNGSTFDREVVNNEPKARAIGDLRERRTS